MSSESVREMRIMRLARRMQLATGLGALLLALSFIVLVFLAAFDEDLLRTLVAENIVPGGQPFVLTPMVNISLMVIAAVGVAILLAALYSLYRLFEGYAGGALFSASSGYWIRQAGLAFFASAIYGVLANTLTVLLVTLNNPEGQRSLAIGVGSDEVSALLLAGLLVVIGHILVLAADLADENNSFV